LNLIFTQSFSYKFTLQMSALLKEYLSSGDTEEAIRCVKDLDVPHYHHELVYEVMTIMTT